MMESDRSLSDAKWMRKIMGNVSGGISGAVVVGEAGDSPGGKLARAATIA